MARANSIGDRYNWRYRRSVFQSGLRDGLVSPAIDAQGARTREHEQQKHEAVEDGCIATVQHRVEAPRSVEHPVRHRHLAGEQEADGPSERTNQDQEATAEFHEA